MALATRMVSALYSLAAPRGLPWRGLLWERLAVARKPVEVDIDVRSEPVHGDQAQVTSEVPRVLEGRGRSVTLLPGACDDSAGDTLLETGERTTHET